MLYTRQPAGRAAARRGPAASRTPAAAELNDLLLPLVKGVGSERAYEMLTLSLQTLGGSGFLQDYPIEQYVRDAKIDSLYEGTTAIQGLDLFFRKILRNGGRALHGAARPDQRVRRGRGRQRPAQGGAGRARPGGRGRRARDRHRDARVRRAAAGAAGRDLPGRAEHHPAPAGPRRPGHRLAAGPPGRGGAGRAGRRRRRPSATGPASTRARWPRPGSSPQTVLPRLAAEREIAETTTLDLMELPAEAF